MWIKIFALYLQRVRKDTTTLLFSAVNGLFYYDMIKIKDLKIGDYFAFKVDGNFNPACVYVRGEYCRELKKYSYYPFDDVNNENFIKGDRLVYVSEDFVF